MTIRYTTTACSLGRLLLAGTAEGVCAIYLGDDDDALSTELCRDFPDTERVRDDDGLSQWLDGVLACLRGDSDGTCVPLDVAGTGFQRRVWQALREIPAGETRSYGDIAVALGQPGASRAVGRACATNLISVLIPCHRAVRGDGALGGYRWGIERKRALLQREKLAATLVAR